MGFIGRIKEEFQVIQERDPAIKTPLEVLLYPSFRVMIQYRKAHRLYEKGHIFWPDGFPRERPEKQVLKFIRGLK